MARRKKKVCRLVGAFRKKATALKAQSRRKRNHRGTVRRLSKARATRRGGARWGLFTC